MPRKLHQVQLSDEERHALQAITRRGVSAVRQYKRARILLLADQGLSDAQIVARVEVGLATVERTRKRFVQERALGALHTVTERPRPGRRSVFDVATRAKITALACTTPPEGRGQWGLRLLADKAVELGYVESISHVTIREILKKTSSARI